jgi:hypothetical protein
VFEASNNSSKKARKPVKIVFFLLGITFLFSGFLSNGSKKDADSFVGLPVYFSEWFELSEWVSIICESGPFD